MNFGTLEDDGDDEYDDNHDHHDDDHHDDNSGELWDTQPAKPEECVATNHTAAGICNLMK